MRSRIYDRKILELSYKIIDIDNTNLEDLRNIVNDEKVTRMEVDGGYYDSYYGSESSTLEFYTEREETDDEYKDRISKYEKELKAKERRKETLAKRKAEKIRKEEEKEKIAAGKLEKEERELLEKLKLKYD